MTSRIGRRDFESNQAYTSGIDVIKMEKNTNIQLDDSIVIDYAPAHQSPSAHHDRPPPNDRRSI
ncbi:hypothetical protein RDI58_028482 [Solanum bulbocastanum]|uniref:Uncharacterized protein n=1 Tax=Solanum bulbocastanum TaxID=147425 RepID=A0AAN8XZ05_SOLBU